MLAEHFPPSFAVGGKRPYRFARYLPEHGWRPVVITGPEPSPERADSTPHPLPDSVVLQRNLLPGWWPEPKGRPSDGTTAQPTTDRPEQKKSLVKTVTGQFQLPLNSQAWIQRWMLRQIREAVDRWQPEVIFSTSSPYYMLRLGIAAKKMTGLPVCLDLRDPWSLNFNQLRKPNWTRAVEARLESRYFAAADQVLLTCEHAAEAYRQLYPGLPEGHIRTIYNSFDPALAPPRGVHIDPDGPIDLIHFGNCYGPRKLATVIRAVARLRDEQCPGAERLRLVNLGRPAQTDLDLLADLGLQSMLHWEPYVPYAEGITRLAKAPLQLLLAYGGETLYVPAKTFDYFLSGAPILCLSGSSELRGMVEDTGTGFVAAPDDVAAVCDALRKVLAAAVEGRPAVTPKGDAVDQFSAPHTAGLLARTLEGLTAR